MGPHGGLLLDVHHLEIDSRNRRDHPFSTATLVHWFKLLPFGTEITRIYLYTGPLFSFLLMVSLLYGFYRTIPNTRVNWQPARPLDKFTSGGFRESLEYYGDDEGAEIIDESDASMAYFRSEMGKLKSTSFGTETIDQLLTEEE